METIGAISTPPGVGAIGIIRISGEKSIPVLSGPFRTQKPLSDFEPRKAYFGRIVDENELLDNVVVTVFISPFSYTGEIWSKYPAMEAESLLEKVLTAFIKRGVELAKPGEFTERAFLNGKMDLLQAEAVADVIEAESEMALEVQDLLSGKLTEWANKIKNKLIDLISGFEAEIEFPDEADVTDHLKEITNPRVSKIEKLIKDIEILISSFDKGILMKEGFTVVIFGAPNTGKSTLLNTLVGYNRVLVTKHPGTTRDYIQEKIFINDIAINIVDMAGINPYAKGIEKQGVEKAKEILKKATLSVFLLDGSRKINSSDELALKTCPDNIPKIWVINKSDCPLKINKSGHFMANHDPLLISALKKEGIEELLSVISKTLKENHLNEKTGLVLTHLRHKDSLKKCQHSFSKALEGLNSKKDIELITCDLHEAVKELNILTGEITADDVMNHIFSKFCIGK